MLHLIVFGLNIFKMIVVIFVNVNCERHDNAPFFYCCDMLFPPVMSLGAIIPPNNENCKRQYALNVIVSTQTLLRAMT